MKNWRFWRGGREFSIVKEGSAPRMCVWPTRTLYMSAPAPGGR